MASTSTIVGRSTTKCLHRRSQWHHRWAYGFLVIGLVLWHADLAGAQTNATAIYRLLSMAANPVKEYLKNDTNGFADLPRLRFDCESRDPLNFHVVDLNGDQLADLLYNGPCGGFPQTAGFLYNGIGYKKIFDLAGGVLQVEPSIEGATLMLYNPAADCIDSDRLGYYRLNRRGDLAAFATLHWMPTEELQLPATPSPIVVRGIVRTAADADDAPRTEACFGDTVLGNRLFQVEDIAHAELLKVTDEWQQILIAHGDSNYRVAWIQNQFENMHPNAILIQRFYEGFQAKNYRQMGECYDDSATFKDAVFDLKNGKEARAMWHMLCQNGKDLTVTFRDVQADDHQGSAHWEAEYSFGPKGRKVHNVIEAKFEFKDGKIITHRDHFKFYKWTRMALGATGTLMGWTPLVKGKIRKTATGGLKKFMADKPEYQ